MATNTEKSKLIALFDDLAITKFPSSSETDLFYSKYDIDDKESSIEGVKFLLDQRGSLNFYLNNINNYIQTYDLDVAEAEKEAISNVLVGRVL